MQTLRDYQETGVANVFAAWESHDSALLVVATGLGKTTMFAEVARRLIPKRTLVLAHRSELIFQAAKRFEEFGIDVDIEMADLQASVKFWSRKPAVISTIQTQCAGNGKKGRMSLFDPNEFGLLVIDEAHHATAASYRKVLDYYKQNPKLKVLLVTATPDRSDKEAMSQVADTVAFEYGILDGINDGWLTLVDQKTVTIESLDFSQMRTLAGDFHGAELSALMESEKPLHGVASATINTIGNRKAVVFAVSVAQAENLAEIFNRHRDGMAGFVCGKTPPDERKQLLREFDAGERQVIVNVGVLTEGWDSPACEVIVMARPTKSRALYTQMVGRGLRPLPGTVDGLATAKERRQAIAVSPKPAMTVLDFAGNAGRHKLISTVDILGGKVSEAARALATEKIKAAGGAIRLNEVLKEAERDVRAEIEARKQAEAKRKAHIRARAKFKTRDIDPFDRYELEPQRAHDSAPERPITSKQRQWLMERGKNPDMMSPSEARYTIGQILGKNATDAQCKVLSRYGYSTEGMSKKDASAIIDAIANNGWKRPAEVA